MNLRKQLDEAYEEGKRDARNGRARPFLFCDERYCHWARQAGYDDGIRELRTLGKTLDRIRQEDA